MKQILLIAAAGAAGTLARFGVSGMVQRASSAARFPWGTLAVNAVGCLIFGLIVALAEERQLIRGETRFILLTGFMGAFTTFSTFAYETSGFLRDAEWGLAAVNVIGQNLLGLVCVFVGIALGRLF